MDYYCYFLIWYIPNKLISHYITTTPELSQNLNSALHALLYIVLHLAGCAYLEYMSINYYIYDLVVITETIIRNHYDFYKLYIYIIHHLVSIYILEMIISQHYLSGFISHHIYLFEISNLAIYGTYHYIKFARYSDGQLFFVKLFQYFWYVYFRVYMFLYNIYNRDDVLKYIYQSSDITSAGLIMIFLTMNVSWSIKLLSGIIRSYGRLL
jgi:hypothetical protein